MNTDTRLDFDALVEQSKSITGLTDFGSPPLSPALDKMIQSINQEAGLTELGVQMRGQHILSLLCNRLRLAEVLRRRPEISEQPLGKLVIIAGLPRSGTTKLQRMLSEDQQFNTLKFWECLAPVPISDGQDDVQQRIKIGEAFSDAVKAFAPDLYKIHPINAHDSEEEHVLMHHSFMAQAVDAEMKLPSYFEWLRTQDLAPMYRQLHQFLQLLADEHGKVGQPWLLKGTYHGMCFDVLHEVFPTARIIYSHRDPVETIPSYISLTSKMRRILSDKVIDAEVGPELLQYWSWHQKQMMIARDRLPDGVVLDVAYADVVGKIWPTINKIYDFAELELSDEARAAMQAWEAENKQHRHGRHEYDVEDYGVALDDIAEACAEYRAKYSDFLNH